jgi:hypothetical protein
MIKKISGALLVFCFITSCFTEKETSTTEVTEDSEVYIELLSEERNYEKSAGECGADSSSCTTVTLVYPYFSGTLNPTAEQKINTRIQSALTDHVLYDSATYESVEAFSNSFISDYEDVKKEFDEAFGWKYEGNAEVLRNDSMAVVVEVKKYSYTGGAHGMQIVEYLNFDPSTGEIISLEDVFTGDYKPLLNRQVKEAFIKSKNLTPEDDLSDHGFMFENDTYYSENFAILPTEIVFYYNQYEVAPYSAGPSEVRVSLVRLKSILQEGFKPLE